jgi:hypothetical protein
MVPGTGEVQGACVEGQSERTHFITAVRTNGHGVIFCLKKFPVGTNKHYSKNTDN